MRTDDDERSGQLVMPAPREAGVAVALNEQLEGAFLKGRTRVKEVAGVVRGAADLET